MLLRSAPRLRRSSPSLRPLASGAAVAALLGLSLGLGACVGGPAETTSASAGTGASDTDATSSTTAEETTSTVTGSTTAGTGESDGTDSDTGGELVPPDLSCPGDPSGACDEVPGAQLEAGAAVISILPSCWERWVDVDGNAKFEATKDELFDCGCDQLCPGDPGYEGPDEGEGDNEIQAIWLAGFGNGRAVNGVRDTSAGLVGDGDGWWARAVVLHQGNTSVAIVVIDTIGYFNDEVVEIRKRLAEQGLEIDHVIVQGIHNHEGPDTMGMWGKELFKPGYDEAYGEQVRRAIVDAIFAADKDRRPVAQMVVGEVDISTYHENGVANVIRDSRDPWVVDETMSAAQLVDADAATIVTLINYGCHPETLADDNLLMTSDFSHALRRTVEKGSLWQSAPGAPGLGGPAIYINAAVGGMMTTLGVEVVNPDGDTYKSASFEKADSIGQLLGEMALDAIALGDVIDAPKLSVANRTFKIDVLNTSFQFLFEAGVLKRTTYPPEDGEGAMRIQTEMSVVNLGPIQMLTVPGEILPELTVGGYDGSRVNAPGVPLIDPNNTSPPDVDAAPQGPYIKDRMGGTYRWIVGLGNDELGYIIPDYDYQLSETMPFVDEAEGDHYEETNSLGPHIAAIVDGYADYLTTWSSHKLGQ
ncbi:MAG: hypothetical protein R3A79_17540 [Nannocystaceae bacterium]